MLISDWSSDVCSSDLISKLTPEQAMYHFLSGYTARVAGTEKGMGSEPSATSSTCFGEPFMPRHPSVYAKMLGEKMAETGANCWLENTAGTACAYGTGERMKIAYHAAMVGESLGGGSRGTQLPHTTHCGQIN